MNGRLVTVALAVSILTVIGCSEREPESHDVGPEAPVIDIMRALFLPLKGQQDPTEIAPGQFVLVSETQEIAGGAAHALIRDTGQTVVAREENDELIHLLFIQNELSYKQNGTYDKVSRQFDAFVEKPQPSPTPDSTDSVGGTGSANRANLNNAGLENTRLKIGKRLQSFISSLAPNLILSPEELVIAKPVGDMVRAAKTNVSVHRLQLSHEIADPPPATRKRDGCGGLKTCKMDLYHMSYVIKVSTDGKDRLILNEYTRSPQVPYIIGDLSWDANFEQPGFEPHIDGFVSGCLSLMVPIGSSESRVLLRQCRSVQDFRFAP